MLVSLYQLTDVAPTPPTPAPIVAVNTGSSGGGFTPRYNFEDDYDETDYYAFNEEAVRISNDTRWELTGGEYRKGPVGLGQFASRAYTNIHGEAGLAEMRATLALIDSKSERVAQLRALKHAAIVGASAYILWRLFLFL